MVSRLTLFVGVFIGLLNNFMSFFDVIPPQR